MSHIIIKNVCSSIVTLIKANSTVVPYWTYPPYCTRIINNTSKRLPYVKGTNFGSFRACSMQTDSGCNPTLYETRKIHHNLSTNEVTPNFPTLKNIPTGIFRNTEGEVLGLGAGKDAWYKNPEYFSFHHMTYYDMHLSLRMYRKTCPNTQRKL